VFLLVASTCVNGAFGSDFTYEKSLCGLSKRSLDEDPRRRTCLRQCRLEDSGNVRPRFNEWEQFCKETAHMEFWDVPCKAYFCCILGCSSYGGDQSQCRTLVGQERKDYIINTLADKFASGITETERCELSKCQAYCAKQSFNTCREIMFKQSCEQSNPALYGCDVDCNGSRPMAPLCGLLLIVGALHALISVGGP